MKVVDSLSIIPISPNVLKKLPTELITYEISS